MQILVTGSSGFLGMALCQRLESRGDQVVRTHSRNANLLHPDALEPFASTEFDVIYHLAAWTQAGDFCLHHPGEQWLINQQLNTTVLGWWQRRQPQAKLVSIGTSCSYAPDSDHREEHYLDGLPIESLFTYGMTKRMLYIGQRALEKQFKLRHLTLIPATLYGPGYHTDGRQMHFIFDLIRKILRGKLYDETVTLWGDGHQRRELIYVDDFISAALMLTDRHDNELVNVSAGDHYTIREFAQQICQAVGYEFERIQFDTSAFVGAREKCLNHEKFARLLPGFPITSLGEGLSRTVHWFQEHRAVLLPPPAAARA